MKNDGDFEHEETEGGEGRGEITTAAGLAKWREGDPERAALVRRLPAETTRSGKWIAAEWHLGSWPHVSKLLGQKKAKNGNR